MELMNAKEAREKVDNMTTSRLSDLKLRVTKQINNAIEQGRSEISLEIPHADHKVVENWLKELGYRVNCGDSQRDGPWFEVDW